MLLPDDVRRINQIAQTHSQGSGDVLVLQRVPRASIPSAANIPQVSTPGAWPILTAAAWMDGHAPAPSPHFYAVLMTSSS